MQHVGKYKCRCVCAHAPVCYVWPGSLCKYIFTVGSAQKSEEDLIIQVTLSKGEHLMGYLNVRALLWKMGSEICLLVSIVTWSLCSVLGNTDSAPALLPLSCPLHYCVSWNNGSQMMCPWSAVFHRLN